MVSNIPSGVLFCVAVNKSTMSLANVVAEMHRYRSEPTARGRYLGKSRSIMRQIAKALSQMHSKGIIHGFVDSSNIGKFDGRWKISCLPGSVARGDSFTSYRLGLHSPPEAFILMQNQDSSQIVASLAPSIEADPTVDIWAYGKLMYEVLTGDHLFAAFSDNDDPFAASCCVQAWNSANIRHLTHRLAEEGISSSGIDLITCCLSPIKSARPRSMLEVIEHPFWRDKNAFNTG
jgi:serine/threonine protein kinase